MPPQSITILRLPKQLLKRFPHESSSSKPQTPSTPSSSALDTGVATPAAVADDSATKLGADGVKSEQPAGEQDGSPKKKGAPTPKAGQKRSAGQMEGGSTPNGTSTSNLAPPKPRGKPGPKKKMKFDGVNGTVIPVSAPKLNPKANQGAINANLRALDRKGAFKARHWERTGFKIKSFTGVLWSSGGAWSSSKRDRKENGESSGADNNTDEAKSSHPGTPGGSGDKSVNGESSMQGTPRRAQSPSGVANGASGAEGLTPLTTTDSPQIKAVA